MHAIPDFRLGLINAWVLMAAYAAGLLLSVATFSKEQRARLFADPKLQLRGIKRWLLFGGQVVAVAYIAMTVFSPLRTGTLWLPVGLAVCVLGCATVIVSLLYFKRTPLDKPVTAGPYRFSRNPQWVGLFLVFLGSALATGAWVPIGMVTVVGLVYHLQILEEEKACLALYGDAYRAYLRAVPRYLLFL